MAVYQGARRRTTVVPRIGLGAARTTEEALPRRRMRGAVRARRRSPDRVGLVLGAIVVAFALAFFSLSQSMRVSATGYRIDKLEVQRQQLEAQAQELRTDLERLAGEPAIRKQALTIGLGQLDRPLVVEAR
jgi:multisubunit Na+/H+ antiporter MnhC subunit